MLIGCKTVAPWPDFPPAEETLMKRCNDLLKLPDKDPLTISELQNSVVDNYTLYHQCANKVEGWQLWYESQRKIYEDAKKKSK